MLLYSLIEFGLLVFDGWIGGSGIKRIQSTLVELQGIFKSTRVPARVKRDNRAVGEAGAFAKGCGRYQSSSVSLAPKLRNFDLGKDYLLDAATRDVNDSNAKSRAIQRILPLFGPLAENIVTTRCAGLLARSAR